MEDSRCGITCMHGSAMQSAKNDIAVDGKRRTLAPCPTKTPSPIHTKFGTIDYVVEGNISADFGNDRVVGGAPTWG